MNITLSLIVPAYNAAPYLEACINSIIANSFRDYEILLVDDGSTDETGIIADRLAGMSEKIKVFHTENRGLCAARNLGMENASGKYIGFVDADDMISPDMLESLVSNMTDDVQLVSCRFVRCNRSDVFSQNVTSNELCKTDTEGTADQLLRGGYGSYVCNKIFRKSILDGHNIFFRVNRLVPEDQFFLMDYLPYCERAVFLESSLYYYIQNEGSIMNTFRQSRIVPEKYVGLPYAWSYTAQVVAPLSKELEVYALSRATMFYQTVLRKLKDPDDTYIQEAVCYVRNHKRTLCRYRWGVKYYLSGLILCVSFPLWAKIFRRGL